MTVVQQKRSWLWGSLFVAMGLLNVAMYIYRGRTDLNSVLTGAGFLLLAPQAFLRLPLGHTLTLTLTLAVAMLGLALMVAGLFVR